MSNAIAKIEEGVQSNWMTGFAERWNTYEEKNSVIAGYKTTGLSEKEAFQKAYREFVDDQMRYLDGRLNNYSTEKREAVVAAFKTTLLQNEAFYMQHDESKDVSAPTTMKMRQPTISATDVVENLELEEVTSENFENMQLVYNTLLDAFKKVKAGTIKFDEIDFDAVTL